LEKGIRELRLEKRTGIGIGGKYRNRDWERLEDWREGQENGLEKSVGAQNL
jgi:hypothetical protein